jgi:hypothetical protein
LNIIMYILENLIIINTLLIYNLYIFENY